MNPGPWLEITLQMNVRTVMPHRVSWLLTGSLALVAAALVVELAPAQGDKPRTPLWTHAFNLQCRNSKEPEFTDKTRKYGLEVFKDDNNNLGLYLLETGSL